MAVHLAASKLYQDKIFALLLENTFTSIPDMAHVLFPLTKYLPLFCYRNKVCFCISVILLLCTYLHERRYIPESNEYSRSHWLAKSVDITKTSIPSKSLGFRVFEESFCY